MSNYRWEEGDGNRTDKIERWAARRIVDLGIFDDVQPLDGLISVPGGSTYEELYNRGAGAYVELKHEATNRREIGDFDGMVMQDLEILISVPSTATFGWRRGNHRQKSADFYAASLMAEFHARQPVDTDGSGIGQGGCMAVSQLAYRSTEVVDDSEKGTCLVQRYELFYTLKRAV